MQHSRRLMTSVCMVVTLGWGVLVPVAAVEAAACNPDSILGRLNCVAKEYGPYTQEAGETSAAEFVGSIISAALALVGVIFVAQMVYAGYLWMTARGEKDMVEKAQDTIRRSIIGLVIVLAAWSIMFFVVDRLVAAAT